MDVRELRRDALAALLLAAAVAGLASRAFDADENGRATLVAVDADDATAVCRRSGYALADFWDRAKAIGVSAVVMREKPVSYLAERGDVLIFSREELEKWRSTGLLAPGSPLKAGTLWTKDPAVFAQITASAERRGLSFSTSSTGGYQVAEFREGLDPGLPAGLDPEVLASLNGRGLLVVAATATGPGLVGVSWDAQGRPEASWPAEAGARLTLEPATIAADAGAGHWMRTAFAGPRRLLVAKLKLDTGVEDNFNFLRASLRRLAPAGARLSLPEPAERSEPRRGRAASALTALAWLIAVVGPLFAARAGLLAFKRLRAVVVRSAPVVSPVAQVAGGLIAAAAAAIALGLAARLAFQAFDGAPSPAWRFWLTAGPLLIGALTLYAIDPEEWSKALERPLTGWTVLRLAAVAAVAILILGPRAAVRLAGAVAPWGFSGAGWWLVWRWREILVGLPCLLQALALIERRAECSECENARAGRWSDPRGWFLLGMLWPIGVIGALCRVGAPAALTLEHTGLVLLAGGALGAGGALWRGGVHDRGPKDPARHRTIVPEAKI